jgi:hypothetical protein
VAEGDDDVVLAVVVVDDDDDVAVVESLVEVEDNLDVVDCCVDVVELLVVEGIEDEIGPVRGGTVTLPLGPNNRAAFLFPQS